MISVQLEHLNKKESYTSTGCTNRYVLRHYRCGKHGVLKESNGDQTTYFEDNICGVYEMDGRKFSLTMKNDCEGILFLE